MFSWHIRHGALIVKAGGIIIYPTESVFGLGCDPLNFEAVSRLLSLKRRDIYKGLIIIAANLDQVTEYIEYVDLENLRVQIKSERIPTTWLLKASAMVPTWITGAHSTIGIRITDHPVAKALCRQLGHPLVSTSANLSHYAPVTRKILLHKYFHGRVDYIISNKLGQYRSPSQIKDSATGHIVRSSIQQ